MKPRRIFQALRIIICIGFFSKLKQWAGADEKQNFRDLDGDFSLESFAHCTDFNPIEIYAYYIGRLHQQHA